MNRRDFLTGLGLIAAGTAVLPSAIAGFVPGSVCTLDNPWLRSGRIVELESGYSKLRIELVYNLKRLYSDPQFGGLQIPEHIIADKRLLVEFDVPPSAVVQYELGQPIPRDIWPHISNLWPSEVSPGMSKWRNCATIKAELFDPGDGIDIYAIEKVLRRT